MSEEEQNAAIAEACKFDRWVIMKRGLYYRPHSGGYTHCIDDAWQLPKEEAKRYEMYVERDDVPYNEKAFIKPVPIPNYTGDLNAMHEAKRALLTTYEMCDLFGGWLSREKPLRNQLQAETDKWTWGQSAAVEARALLKTLGLWKEESP